MPSKLTRTTTDHDEIRRWAEERGGEPAEVERTEREGETGIIRLDFPGYKGAGSLKHISWDEWFQKFDDSGLALVYQDHTAAGQRSNFNKLVGRETADARAHGNNRASRRSLGGRARTAVRRGAGAAARRSGGRTASSRKKPTTRTRRTAARDTGRRQQGRGRGEGAGSREAPRAIAARLTGRAADEAGSRRSPRGTSRSATGRGRKGASRSGTKGGGRRGTSRTRRTSRGRNR